MSVITNKWNDGSGDSINIESPSFQGNQTVKISSPVQKGTSKRSMKFIGKCKKDSSKQVILTVEQEASTYTYDLTLNSDNTEIAAKGGTATITAVLKTYRNGNLVSTDNVTPVLSGSATGFSISGSKVTASNRGISAGAERSITVTGKFSNTFDGQTVSSTIVIKQSENYIISLKIGGGSTTKFLSPTITYSAAGGSNPFTGWVVYSSGEQANVDTWNNYNWILPESYFTKSIANGILTVTGEYRGTKVGDKRTGVLTLTLNSVATNNKTIETSLTLTQGANVETGIAYCNISITYFTYPDIPASGGSVNPKLAYTQAKIQNYSSGGSKNIDTISSGATLTYGKSGTAGGGNINATTGVVSVGTRGTTVGNRWEIGEFFVIIKLNGKEVTSPHVICYQEANEASYGVLTGGSISASNIPASGGTSSTSISNMSQTISYTSGSTRAGTVTYSKTDEITVSSLGTTIKARTKVGQVTVTYTGEGGATANKTVDIYQAANKVESYNYSSWNIVISASPTTIAASGGTSKITASCTRTRTAVYTSGSTRTFTNESATPTLAISGTGFTLSGTTVIASKNNVAARTATVTASYSGATSKSVTITQSAGPDGIGYMQIQGNGIDHYIFQVGRTPNTRSNDVQTLSEEPAEVATETKSESLFAKIKRIVTNLN